MEEEEEYNHPKQVDTCYSRNDYPYDTDDGMIAHAFEEGLWPFATDLYSSKYKLHLYKRMFDYWYKLHGGDCFFISVRGIRDKDKLVEAYISKSLRRRRVDPSVSDVVNHYFTVLDG